MVLAAAPAEAMNPSQRVQPSWETMYTALKGYNAREGHGRVPWNHDEGGLRLGVWLSLQWTDQRAGRMSRAREIKLANAGVDWRAPPPPLRSTVSPDHENERKWDQGRAVVLAERHAARAIAAGRDVKPDVRPFDDRIRAWDRHWQPYSAATDIHTAAWRRRVMAPPPPPLPPPASKAKEPGARRTRTPPADSRQAARAQAADESGKSRPASQAAGAGVGSHAHRVCHLRMLPCVQEPQGTAGVEAMLHAPCFAGSARSHCRRYRVARSIRSAAIFTDPRLRASVLSGRPALVLGCPWSCSRPCGANKDSRRPASVSPSNVE